MNHFNAQCGTRPSAGSILAKEDRMALLRVLQVDTLFSAKVGCASVSVTARICKPSSVARFEQL
jgi:hypothetical protein